METGEGYSRRGFYRKVAMVVGENLLAEGKERKFSLYRTFTIHPRILASQSSCKTLGHRRSIRQCRASPVLSVCAAGAIE